MVTDRQPESVMPPATAIASAEGERKQYKWVLEQNKCLVFSEKHQLCFATIP